MTAQIGQAGSRDGATCALIFDVDGVIGDTEAINAEASVEVFAELYGVRVEPEEFRPYVGMGDQAYMQGPARAHGVEIDVERATRMREERILHIMRTRGLATFPGVIDLIQSARESRDFKLAIATSGRRDKAGLIIRGAGVDPAWFDEVVTGDEVTHRKPDPEIYLKTIARLGLPARRCVVVEDAPAGVTAAKRAGAKCVAVTNTVARDQLDGADRVVAALSELSLTDIRRLAG